MHHGKPENIAIIGGGRGGVETALMLAKQRWPDGTPRYHITLIEAQKSLLNGASALASRIHLGGEYPLDPQTASDCLKAAVIWKLLMPANIFTPTPPMKFLIAEKTHQDGLNKKQSNALTLRKYFNAYESLRQQYAAICERIHATLGWDSFRTETALFGSSQRCNFHVLNHENARTYSLDKAQKGGKEPYFFRPLSPVEFADYHQGRTRIAGGFQTPELGLNVPKYLAMLEQEVKNQSNITVLTRHAVDRQGISPQNNGRFLIHYDHGKTIQDKHGKDIEFNQVVQAAWQGGPAVMPTLNDEDKTNQKEMTVLRRAMLLIDLPEGWRTPPAFIMLGNEGGMLSPYNDKTAICYLPTIGGHIKEHKLTADNPTLPVDWQSNWDEPITQLVGYASKHYPEALGRIRARMPKQAWNELDPRTKWTLLYFEVLKERFPVLANLSYQKAKPRLIVRDTLNFQEKLEQRQHESAHSHGVVEFSLRQELNVAPQQIMQQRMEYEYPPVAEVKRGLFTLYPTKATYSLYAALQTVSMINQRSDHPKLEALLQAPQDILGMLLARNKHTGKLGMEELSLAHMKEPDNYDHFFAEHPDLSSTILANSWPSELDATQSWVERAKQERTSINELGI